MNDPMALPATGRLTRLRVAACLAVALIVVLAVPPASADDTWADPYSGIRHLHRKTDDPKWNLHVLAVDLTDPGIRLMATPTEARKTVVSSFGERFKLQAAINGDFFTFTDYHTIGLAAGLGKVWPDSSTDDEMGGFLAVGAGNRVELSPHREVRKPEPWMRDIVGGRPQIVEDGRVCEPMDQPKLMAPRHPRTAVGLSKDRKTLFLLVVDGRQPDVSVGMTGKELARTFLDLGAYSAMNLDGGGSSAVWLGNRGVLNSPSDKKERAVANHLGVFAASSGPRPKGAVKGKVMGGDGAPVEGAKVATGSRSDVTDKNGCFQITQLPKGNHTLTATAAGGAKTQIKVTVEAWKTAEVTIDLAAPASPATTGAVKQPAGNGNP